MQSQSTENNVVSLFSARTAEKSAAVEATEEAAATPAKKESFADTMRRNAENSERMRQERNKANQSVLRSYRIKN